ncbi:hypothetical protein GBF38_015910 [Nibea albiflora]|uniref:Uncharacterized protein n=1 Tax=Nibea albiflora TaxID=240163 RepID=A0ACB7FI14_NIBAL|nr:hypothetical protein GBF38_015910 [Nibea albiflora]
MTGHLEDNKGYQMQTLEFMVHTSTSTTKSNYTLDLQPDHDLTHDINMTSLKGGVWFVPQLVQDREDVNRDYVLVLDSLCFCFSGSGGKTRCSLLGPLGPLCLWPVCVFWKPLYFLASCDARPERCPQSSAANILPDFEQSGSSVRTQRTRSKRPAARPSEVSLTPLDSPLSLSLRKLEGHSSVFSSLQRRAS